MAYTLTRRRTATYTTDFGSFCSAQILPEHRHLCALVASWTISHASQTFSASLVMHYSGQREFETQDGVKLRVQQFVCGLRSLFSFAWRR